MSYQNRRPPIQLEISKKDFDLFLQVVFSEKNMINDTSIQIKNKLLKYSCIESAGVVRFGLFPSEAREILLLLINVIVSTGINRKEICNV